MKNNDLKISLLFTLIGLAAGFSLGYFQLSAATEEVRQQIVAQLGSTEILLVISTVQTAIYAFISSFVGLKLARKVHLSLNFRYEKNSVIIAFIIATVLAITLSGFDKYVFAPYLPHQIETYRFSLWYFISSVLYGGIVEELMMRLFLISLIVFVLWRLFARANKEESIPSWIYVSAILLAALIFAAGHLPATSVLLGLSTPIIIRAFLLNGLAGIGFGYLYWKSGLAYAILAHMLTHVFNQLIVMPLLF
ncbi:CPBP family intramembrane glutamic endopeptidase [Heliorestis convoluta]|uniref:CPBP family intramembrane metalloprotease n=1 Tax=Heliorestis convoluta TaxID=356322 RepID=A0A5Q2N8A4_9FIRM|nr:CPBP family intramembrane glutamic endopeptidase [Heliorestis convoluta]QGG48480.1 CPBP family intramembrane metalloprotease [Heliorestis convoluta]